MENKWKFPYVVVLAVLYCVSFLLLTIGFFTPKWVLNFQQTSSPYSIYFPHTCETVGIISGHCRYPYGDLSIGTSMQMATFMCIFAMIVVYTCTILLGTGYALNMLDNEVYVVFVAVTFGVLYPAAALLVLVASIFVEAQYGSQVGFSVILCNIAGAMMLIFYVGLRVYDQIYSNRYRKAVIT